MNLRSIHEYVLRSIDDMEKIHLRSIDDKPQKDPECLFIYDNI